jgi:hypothetical protein
MTGVIVHVDLVPADTPAEPLSIVMFGAWWRVMAGHRIVAVCETRAEAAAYIARQMTRASLLQTSQRRINGDETATKGKDK